MLSFFKSGKREGFEVCKGIKGVFIGVVGGLVLWVGVARGVPPQNYNFHLLVSDTPAVQFYEDTAVPQREITIRDDYLSIDLMVGSSSEERDIFFKVLLPVEGGGYKLIYMEQFHYSPGDGEGVIHIVPRIPIDDEVKRYLDGAVMMLRCGTRRGTTIRRL